MHLYVCLGAGFFFFFFFSFYVAVDIARPSESQLTSRRDWVLRAYLTERMALRDERTNESFQRQLELLNLQLQAMEIVRENEIINDDQVMAWKAFCVIDP